MSKGYSLATFVAAASLLLAATAANAITLTLDDYSKTVVQPTSGGVWVDFTGTVTITPGYEAVGGSASSLWNATGDMIAGAVPDFTFNLTGVIFRIFVDSTDLGLYNLASNLTGPARFSLAECQIGGWACNNSLVNYSVNVVAPAPVPEPSSIGLLGFGLFGFAFGAHRRRRTNN